MHRVMIIDDNFQILELLRDFLEEGSFKVQTFSDSQKALESIPLYKPHLIISDIKMEPLNGIQFFHKAKPYIGTSPWIFITAFADLLLIDEAIEMGAYSLIKKPFDFEGITEIVKSALNLNDDAFEKNIENNYIKIDLERFISGNSLPCALHIKLRKNHFIKLADKGQRVPTLKLKKYRDKKISYLYVLKEEYCDFLGFNIKLLKKVDERKEKISHEKVANFVLFTHDLILENTFVKDFKKETIDDVLEYTATAINIIKEKPNLYKLLTLLSEENTLTYTHSLLTAVLAFLVAKKSGFTKEPALFKIFLSGLLHDIGLKRIDDNILQKSPILWSKEEEDIYRSHPTLGMETLNEIGGLPEDVILATYHHHENLIGTGYPNKINRSQKSSISQLISVVDIVDHFNLQKDNFTFQNYKRSLDKVLGNRRVLLNREYLLVLKDILENPYDI